MWKWICDSSEGKDEEGSSYFMEIHDRIQSLDIVLRGTDRPNVLAIKPKQIIVQRFDGSKDYYPLAVEAEPSSCAVVQSHKNEGIGIRLQIRPTSPEPQTGLLSTSVKRIGNEVNRMERGICQCGCKTCGLTLFVNNVKFNRVLPLPTKNWKDLFCQWSCCDFHSSTAVSESGEPLGGITPIKRKALRPREGDCLLDEFHLLVHHKTVERKNILLRDFSFDVESRDHPESKPQLVKCARCRANVGETLTTASNAIEAYKFYKNNIEILSVRKHMSETVARPIFFSEFFLERIVAQQMQNALQSHEAHLLIIQDYMGRPYMFVRLLNVNSRLFVNNGKASEGIAASTREFPTHVSRNSGGVESKQNKANLHGGTGDHAEQKKTSMSDSGGGGESDAIRRDGPPRIHGNKVAEVIEKLFSFSTNLLSIGRTCNEVRNADESGCERIVKLMYSCVQDEGVDKTTMEWTKDERVRSLHYPPEICSQILLVLVSSTLTMPVAYRVVDNFMIGFLRLD